MDGVRLVWVALALVLAATFPADAHRQGESYLYLDVTEAGISGEYHLRLADLMRALPLDTDGDGQLSEAEFEAGFDAIRDYLVARTVFYAGETEHRPVLGSHEFFAEGPDLQALVHYELPTLGPPPDMLDASFVVLFDGPDPDHRTLLLQASNTRLGLVDNESYHSLVFAPGRERQTLDLRPAPAGRVLFDFFRHGLRQALTSPAHLCILALIVLPLGLRGPMEPGRTAGLALALSAGATAGLVAGMVAQHASALALDGYGKRILLVFVLASMAAIWSALRSPGPVPSLVAAFVSAALVGLLARGYYPNLGLAAGMPALTLAGFAAGIAAATLALACVLGPLGWIARQALPRGATLMRAAAVLIASTGVVWLAVPALAGGA